MVVMDRRILVWNCRGAGSEVFVRHAKETLRDARPDVCFNGNKG